MTKILFDANRITKEELAKHKDLIVEILDKRNNPPKFKKLKGISYQNNPTYRAKIDKQQRLVYTFVQHGDTETLLLLEINKHNYNKLKRQLENPVDHHIESEQVAGLREQTPGLDELTLVPTVSYLNKHLEIDEHQQQVLRTFDPLIIPGPPGAGKTALIYNLMQSQIYSLHDEDNESKFLYISLYDHLVQARKNEFEAMNNEGRFTVEFSTWDQLMHHAFPNLKPCRPALFADWLKSKLPKESAERVHYDLSLIAALGAEHYLKLGKRQCYYKDNPTLQKLLINLLNRWNQYLAEEGLFDPMVTLVPIDPQQKKKYRLFIDEAQNLPPLAFAYLIQLVLDGNIVIGIDSQQCLRSSPFTQSCIKELMHQHFGQYKEQVLTKTWRCTPEVARVANKVMQGKNALEAETYRREYHEVVSALPEVCGLASWVDEKYLSHLKPLGALPQTVVIAADLAPGERKKINKALGTNNILTPEQAIGLDFSTVILWKPFSMVKCLLELLKKEFTHLSLDQSIALNALYVAVSRAELMLYIHEPDKRGLQLGARFLGELPNNLPPLVSTTQDPKAQREQWENNVEKLLQLKHYQEAQEILTFHLHYAPDQVTTRIEQARFKNEGQVTEALPTPVHKAISTRQVTLKSRKPKAQKQAPPPKKNKQTLEEYMEVLIKCPTEPNINALFNHPRASEILFERKLSNGSSLFQQLIVSIDNQLLTSFLQKIKSKYTSMITAEILCYPFEHNPAMTPFYCLTIIDAGIDLLSDLAEKNIGLFDHITRKVLCDPVLYFLNQTDYISSLFWFSLSERKQKILFTLIKNRKFAQLITGEALCMKTHAPSSWHSNTSPMYWLSRHSVGRELLLYLLNEGIDIARGITGEALSLIHNDGTSTNANICAFYCLCTDVNGAQFLLKLLELNAGIAKKITIQSLTKTYHTQNSALYYLVMAFDQGVELLHLLLSLNTDLINQLTKDDLFTDHSINEIIVNLFCCLASSSEGLKLLRLIFNTNPQLSRDIEKSHFLTIHLDSMDKAPVSIFFSLCNNVDGISIMEQILMHNPQLAFFIGTEILSLRPQDGDYIERRLPTFHTLIQFQEGRELLLKIIKLAPEAALILSTESFNIYPCEDKEQSLPLLTRLQEFPEGRAIISQVRENQINNSLIPHDSYSSHFFKKNNLESAQQNSREACPEDNSLEP